MVPDLVTMLSSPPWKFPYSAPAPRPLSVTSSIQSTFGSRKSPPNPGEFTVTRTDTTGDLTVYYSVDQSSTADGVDYVESLSGSVLIGDGQSSETIAITPVNDGEVEGDETLILSLEAGDGYVVG